MEDREALVAVGSMMVALNGSFLPARLPSWAANSFYGRPLNIQTMRPIPAGSGWTDLIVVESKKDHVGIIKSYVATSQGSLAVAGLEFRWIRDGAPVTGMTLGVGVELNKENGTDYPVIPRPMFLPVLDNMTSAILQVRNPTGIQREAIGAAYGWWYTTYDGSTYGVEASVTDATYKPFLGQTHG